MFRSFLRFWNMYIYRVKNVMTQLFFPFYWCKSWPHKFVLLSLEPSCGNLMLYQDSFSIIFSHFSLSELFNPLPPQQKEDGIRFVGLVTKLMERLLDYRTVVLGDDNIDNRMSCTVNVLVSSWDSWILRWFRFFWITFNFASVFAAYFVGL